MKLDFQNVTVERSSAFQSQHFDIGNKRIILEILRGKMYSNPIQTICQEISSNARDAHREIGKDSTPIEIKLPNRLEPTFWIRDFGPGITPERMADVFIKYGCSTKREDNVQAGGWGLGAKSPFSYSDTFTVVSITPEGSGLMLREYIAHIDESGLGQMSCVKESPTTEAQGTRIIITPKESDYQQFTEQVIRATAFWPVKPTILGVRNWTWPKFSTEYKGKGWEIHDSRQGYINGISPTPYALLDGIPYPIKGELLYKTRPSEFPNFKNIALRVHFKIGELPITANREEIDYQEKSIRILEDRISAAFVELRQTLTQSVTKAPSLSKAIIAWNAAKRHHHFGHLVTGMHWKPANSTDPGPGISINGGDISLKGVYANLYYSARNEFGFTRDTIRPTSFFVDETTLFVEDDTPTTTVSRQRLANLFSSHPGTKRLYLVSFYRKATTEKIKNPDGTEENKEKIVVDEANYIVNKKAAEMVCHWHHLDTLLLSNYEKKSVVTKKPDGTPKPLQMRFINPNSLLIQSDTFENLTAVPTGSPPVTKYYLESSGNYFTFDTLDAKGAVKTVQLTKRDLDNALSYLSSLNKGPIKLHLVNTRHRPLMDATWVNLHTHVGTLVKQEAAKYGGKLFTRRRGRPADHFSEQLIKQIHKNLSSITDQDSLFVKYFKDGGTSSDSHHLAYNLAKIFEIQVQLDSTDPMEDMYNKIRQQYPLLCNIQFYHGGNEMSSVIADLISYVNMKNEKKKAP